jgi:hypothetical protein
MRSSKLIGVVSRVMIFSFFLSDFQLVSHATSCNIITSYSPETALKVAFELLKILTSQEEMEVIKKAMGF